MARQRPYGIVARRLLAAQSPADNSQLRIIMSGPRAGNDPKKMIPNLLWLNGQLLYGHYIDDNIIR